MRRSLLALTVFTTLMLLSVSGAAAQGPGLSEGDVVIAGIEADLATADAVLDTVSADVSTEDDASGINIQIDLGGNGEAAVPSQSVVLIILLTLMAVAPSLLIMMTSFTRIVIVFSMLRSALGVQTTPPNQVIVGLSIFLMLFVMSPVFTQANDTALQPYLAGEIDQSVAFDNGMVPFKQFMLANTGQTELKLTLGAGGSQIAPESAADISLSAIVPAFILSELKAAFILGFIILLPFLVIDLITSAALMSLGMMMLPPVFVSLPLKILLFVMVDGWVLVTETLLTSFNGL